MSEKLSIVIMAHPDRREWAEMLSKKLKAPVVYDRKSNIWDTCRRAWLKIDRECEYGLVLQDDAILCKDFAYLAETYLRDHDNKEKGNKKVQEYIHSFYAGKLLGPRIDRARAKKEDFVIVDMIYNEIALCMKTKFIDDMVAYCDLRKANTDQEICNWCRTHKILIKYTVPSLIDHRQSESVYKRIYKKSPNRGIREAYYFIDRK